MAEVNTKVLDDYFYSVLALPSDSEREKFDKALKLWNIKINYCLLQLFWPPLDAKQREAFNECERIAIEVGISR